LCATAALPRVQALIDRAGCPARKSRSTCGWPISGICYDRFVDDLISLPRARFVQKPGELDPRLEEARAELDRLAQQRTASSASSVPACCGRHPPGTCPPTILDNIRRFEQGLSLLRHIDAAQGW
jgi:hypothetical protein